MPYKCPGVPPRVLDDIVAGIGCVLHTADWSANLPVILSKWPIVSQERRSRIASVKNWGKDMDTYEITSLCHEIAKNVKGGVWVLTYRWTCLLFGAAIIPYLSLGSAYHVQRGGFENTADGGVYCSSRLAPILGEPQFFREPCFCTHEFSNRLRTGTGNTCRHLCRCRFVNRPLVASRPYHYACTVRVCIVLWAYVFYVLLELARWSRSSFSTWKKFPTPIPSVLSAILEGSAERVKTIFTRYQYQYLIAGTRCVLFLYTPSCDAYWRLYCCIAMCISVS